MKFLVACVLKPCIAKSYISFFFFIPNFTKKNIDINAVIHLFFFFTVFLNFFTKCTCCVVCKFNCFSYPSSAECAEDSMCEYVNFKCQVKSQFMSKGLGSVGKTGWGKGAKRHALNIYVRTKTGADTSPRAAASRTCARRCSGCP